MNSEAQRTSPPMTAYSIRTVWFATVGLALFLGWVDWKTGRDLNFFVFYFLPVGFAARSLGLGAGVGVSVMCALVWYCADFLSGAVRISPVYSVWNTLIRLCSFLIIAWSVHRIQVLLAAERETSEALRRSIAEVKVLKGLLRICAVCKRIVDDHGQWQKLEAYVTRHSEAKFTHGYCPDCARKMLEEAGIVSGPK